MFAVETTVVNTEPPILSELPPVIHTPPVSVPESAAPQPWGFWLTVGFGWCVAGVYVVAQVVVLVVVAAVQGVLHDPEATQALGLNGLVASIGICVGTPIALGMCCLFAWLRREMRMRDYLGLIRVSWKVLAASFGAIVLFNVVFGYLGVLLGRPDVPESMIEIYRTAGFLPLLWLAIIVGAPVVEEVLFRGFLFKGIEHSAVGGVGAVLLTSLAWAAIHLQYDLYDMGVIFVMGLLLGEFRRRTGSLVPALFMHVLNNLAATIMVGWMLSDENTLSALL